MVCTSGACALARCSFQYPLPPPPFPLPPSPLPSSEKLFVSVWHLRQILSDSIRFRTHPFHRRRLGPVRQFHPTLILEGSTFTKLVQSLNYVIAFY